MLNYVKGNCIFCDTELEYAKVDDYHNYFFYKCPVCGNYEKKEDSQCNGYYNKNKVASYLYYKGNFTFDWLNQTRGIVLSSKEYYDKKHSDDVKRYRFVSPEEIEAFYPKNFSERINRILLGFASLSEYVGDIFTIEYQCMLSAMFINRYDKAGLKLSQKKVREQLNQILDYLINNHYIDISVIGVKTDIQILPEGWKRIDELQAEETESSKNVFVAMSFADDMKKVRKAIKTSILDCGYIPRIMDEIEHNHQIVPEMLYEIRKAKFVIAELTGHNNGAYFEAGYALGQGKEVIQICSKDRFGSDGHFDVKQINTILWETTEELTQKLSARIKATIN